MTPTQIHGPQVHMTHDPHAHLTLVRRRVEIDEGCPVCGGPALVEFGTLPDDRLTNRADWLERAFCGAECFRWWIG